MPKVIAFDRKGRCPVCHQVFRSERCPHSWDYVNQVVDEVNRRRKGQDFLRDVGRLSRKGR